MLPTNVCQANARCLQAWKLAVQTVSLRTTCDPPEHSREERERGGASLRATAERGWA